MQLTLPRLLKVLGGQDWHTLLLLEPVAVEKVPPGQPVHEDTPCREEKVPVGHARQAADELAPVLLEYLPMLHGTHVVLLVAPDEAE